MTQPKLHNRVLTVGPDLKGLGGISAVLQAYKRTLPSFTFSASNSRHGTVAGILPLALTLLKMPFYRLAGYSILHAHVATGKSYIRKRAILKWAKLLGFRTVFHCHAGGFPAYAEKVGKEKISRFINSCDTVAVLSAGWKKYFTEELHCSKVAVIDNIIESPAIPVERPRLNTGDTISLVFFGRICKEKGFYDLLDALSILKPAYGKRLRLIVGGDADASSFNADMASRGLEDMVEYVGWVRGQEKDGILRKADIMVLPSYFEGIPITLLEAGVYRMPVIATRVGGIPEVIEDGLNGILIEPGKPADLAAAIERYLQSPDLVSEHGQAATLGIAKHLPEAISAELAAMYRSLE